MEAGKSAAMASLQEIVDNNRHRVIVSSLRARRFAAMAEIVRRAVAKTDESAPKNKSGGGVAVPCPWGKESGPETFTAVNKGEIKRLSTDLKPRSVVNKLRIDDILAAMSASNATDKPISEEWMDELSDLVWCERDRLGAKTED
jgi:hypothetical protein